MGGGSGYGHNKKTGKKTGWNVREPVSRHDTAPSERVDLRVEDFDRLLEQKGVVVKVYRSMYCPNVKSADGAEHEIDCQLCNGSGFIDVDPLVTKALIQNQELEKLYESKGGDHDGNTVMMTFPIGIELQYFTLIEVCDFTDLYYQRVFRKAGSLTDNLKFKACRVNSVVDQDGARYYQDQDFKLNSDGNVLWGSVRKPADGKIYSIHYEMHVQFRAVRALHVNRFTQYKAIGEENVQMIKMPECWMCTKEFLVRRKDHSGNDIQEGPFGDHTNTTGENDGEP